MKIRWIVAPIFLLFSGLMQAQELLLIPDKQGSFNTIDWGIYTHYNCGFTKSEKEANAQKVAGIIDAVRSSNPVLHDLKGFVGQATLFAKNCEGQNRYGIPGAIRFEFCSFFLDKVGKAVYSTIEPPCWYLYINLIDKRDKHTPPQPDKNEEVKAGFNYEMYKAVAEKLNELFYTRDVRQPIAPGIDRYGDEVVIFNPDRPPYWSPVTVEEAYQRHFNYWKAAPDKVQSAMALKLLEQEYASFTEDEKRGYAYAMGKGAFAQVGSDSKAPALVKANPAYWNKNLPKSAIQFITFILPANKAFLQQQVRERLQHNSISYHEARFEESLDINLFAQVIDR